MFDTNMMTTHRNDSAEERCLFCIRNKTQPKFNLKYSDLLNAIMFIRQKSTNIVRWISKKKMIFVNKFASIGHLLKEIKAKHWWIHRRFWHLYIKCLIDISTFSVFSGDDMISTNCWRNICPTVIARNNDKRVIFIEFHVGMPKSPGWINQCFEALTLKYWRGVLEWVLLVKITEWASISFIQNHVSA